MLSRRLFLQQLAALASSSCWALSAQGKGIRASHLLSPLTLKSKDGQSTTSAVARINLQTLELATVETPFLGHGMTPTIDNPQIWLVIGKRPTSFSCLLNTSQMQVVQLIPAMKGFHFYGHGVATLDHLLLIEESKDPAKSMISVWNKKGDQRLAHADVYGVGAHDIQATPRDFVVAAGATNQGSKKASQISLVNYQTNSLQHKILSFSHEAMVDHFQVVDAKVFVGLRYKDPRGSAPIIAIASLNEKTLRPLLLPEPLNSKVKKSALSVAVNPHRKIVSVTTTGPNKEKAGHVLMWNYETTKFIGSIEMPESLGITYNHDYTQLWASGSKGDILNALDSRQSHSFDQIVDIWGAHLYFQNTLPLG